MRYERSQRLVSRWKVLRRLTIGAFARFELTVLNGHKNRTMMRQIRRCRRDAESLLTGNEAFLLHSLALSQRNLGGAMAEVGVFEGSSAQLICEAKGEVPLYLFDTFCGLPKPEASETRFLREGQYSANLFQVRQLLRNYPQVIIRQGLFPKSTAGLEGVRFSMVHLDADLYHSTRAALDFFWPRMVVGGIVLVHDYSLLPGVARAVAEFLGATRAQFIELPTSQGMIVHTGPAIAR